MWGGRPRPRPAPWPACQQADEASAAGQGDRPTKALPERLPESSRYPTSGIPAQTSERSSAKLRRASPTVVRKPSNPRSPILLESAPRSAAAPRHLASSLLYLPARTAKVPVVRGFRRGGRADWAHSCDATASYGGGGKPCYN